MKRLLLILLVPFFFGCSISQHTVSAPGYIDLPEKVLFLAQSGTQDAMFQTVIDLENNELVVLEYNNNILFRVYRTGIQADPRNYRNFGILGTDAPFDSEDDDQQQDVEEEAD